MPTIADFLTLLAEDPTKQAEYDKCTDTPMDEFDLTDAQKDLIRYGSPQEVRDAIMDEGGGADQAVIVYILRMLPPR